jgi:hypothetical protein
VAGDAKAFATGDAKQGEGPRADGTSGAAPPARPSAQLKEVELSTARLGMFSREEARRASDRLKAVSAIMAYDALAGLPGRPAADAMPLHCSQKDKDYVLAMPPCLLAAGAVKEANRLLQQALSDGRHRTMNLKALIEAGVRMARLGWEGEVENVLKVLNNNRDIKPTQHMVRTGIKEIKAIRVPPNRLDEPLPQAMAARQPPKAPVLTAKRGGRKGGKGAGGGRKGPLR